MTVPTKPVTINLADFGGSAVDNVLVTATMSGVDMTEDGVVVSTKTVSGRTSGGLVVLNCFPNALAPTGLGTKGTKTTFSANIPGSKPLRVVAVVPNRACNLVEIQVDADPVPPPPAYVTETAVQSLTNKELVNPSSRTTTLVDGSNITWDADDGQIAFVDLITHQVARKLENIQNIKPGATYRLFITNTLGGEDVYAFGDEIVQVEPLTPINQVAGSVTVYEFTANPTGTLLLATRKGLPSQAPAPTPAPTPAPAPAEAAILFGSRADGAYAYGALPSLVTADQASKDAADASILAHFQKLVDHHVVGTDIAPGLPAGGMMPRFTGAYADPWYNADTAFKMGAVSEGFGYWLILCAIMHGATMGNYPVGHPKAGQARPTPKQIFDGMLKTILARPAYYYKAANPSNPLNWLTDHLMEWSLNGNANTGRLGGVIGASNEDAYSAPDGDLDIAIGLDMAARQWPNDPTYNYADLAKKRVSALKHFHYRTDGTGLALKKPSGYGGDSTPFYMVRPSDFMFNHFRTFATLMNDPFWLGAATGAEGTGNVYDRQIALMQYIQTNFSPATGLLPDFIENTENPGTTDPLLKPMLAKHKLGHGDTWLIQQVTDNAPLGNFGQEDVYFNHGQKFNANSLRVMFRLVCEYLMSGNASVKTALVKMMDFFDTRITARGGTVSGAFASAYALDGTPSYPTNNNAWTPGGDLAELFGSILAGYCADAKYATNLNLMWRWARGDDGGRMDQGYYAGELELMGRLVAAGLWWTRRKAAAIPTGTSLPAPPAPAPAPAPTSAPAPAPAPAPTPAPAPATDGETILQAAFDAGDTGFWLKNVLPDLLDGAGAVKTTWADTIKTWKTHAGVVGRNFVEPLSSAYPLIGTDLNGFNYVQGYSGNTIAGGGGHTGSFYFAFLVNWVRYTGTMFSDQSDDNHGIRCYESADEVVGTEGGWVLAAGKGAGFVKAVVGNGKAKFTTFSGLVLIDGYFDSANQLLSIRRNMGTPGTAAVGQAALAAGNADMMLFAKALGNATAADPVGNAKTYCIPFLRRLPTSTERDAIARAVAARGGFTIP